MMYIKFMYLLLVYFSFITVAKLQGADPKSDKWVRWCTSSKPELEKCNKLESVLTTARQTDDRTFTLLKELPVFTCVKGIDSFDCMMKIESGLADMMTLDSGQGYFAGRYHNLLPIMAEQYSIDINDPTTFQAVAIVKKGTINKVNILKLHEGKIRSCHPAIGDSAGWVFPIGRLMKDNRLQVTECNSPVKSVNSYFGGDMCLPGAINSFYNTFGNNPVKACNACIGLGDNWCSSGDPYAGYDGALRCLVDDKGDIAFVRHDTVDMIERMNFFTKMYEKTSKVFNKEDYELVCPDNQRKPLEEYESCNWGSPQSAVVMTSGMKDDKIIQLYKAFLQTISDWFGARGSQVSKFKLFESEKYLEHGLKVNLMFNDATKQLVNVGSRDSYYTWVSQEFRDHVVNINRCPQDIVRWCVISLEEKAKCEDMMMAFKARELKPELDCIMAVDTATCMKMIRFDDADLTTLDAADVYYAGRTYGLVPIANEDYGDMSGTYSVVAITHKINGKLSVFNLKGKRTCHGGVRTGDGFVMPARTLIDTTQIRPEGCSLYQNMGELFARSCIPGVLEKEYNMQQDPINLCESCASGSYRKCQRNSNELYYKSTGAFRCLVENGGDMAFGRHLTVQDNTDGKNQAIWARNRRSDDYELMCKDGSRRAISGWKTCNLGVVPSNAVVTAAHKDQNTRDIYFNLLNYAQMYFSSDSDRDFSLFDSGIVYNDLLFSDATVRLLHVAKKNQSYDKYLGVEFTYAVESLQKFTCDLNEEDVKRFYSTANHKAASFFLISVVLVLFTQL